MKLFYLILLLLTLSSPAYADPWGTDADLAYFNKNSAVYAEASQPSSLLARFGAKAINFHQEVISPADGPRSHFLPSSSQYTLEAMQKHGFFAGFLYGCDRLMRENDEEWVYKTIKDQNGKLMKWNPVP
jgi:putative component of membrane protein insertase Oxa1/YidC/SpoIIIJ protein YidD